MSRSVPANALSTGRKTGNVLSADVLAEWNCDWKYFKRLFIRLPGSLISGWEPPCWRYGTGHCYWADQALWYRMTHQQWDGGEIEQKQDLMQTKPEPWNRSFLEQKKKLQKYRHTILKIGRFGLWMSELKINMKKDYFHLDPFEHISPGTLRKRENCSWRQKKSIFLIQVIWYDTAEVFNVLDHKSEICKIPRMQG